ncbi:Uncharacterised protein [Bordetella pertussis]|nr:Uncharacterised protein [Bordetella pertussis]
MGCGAGSGGPGRVSRQADDSMEAPWRMAVGRARVQARALNTENQSRASDQYRMSP